MNIKAKYENKMSFYVRLISVGLTFCFSFPIFSNNSGAVNKSLNIAEEINFPDGAGGNSFKCTLLKNSNKKEYECKNNNVPLDASGMQFCTNPSSCVNTCGKMTSYCHYDLLKSKEKLLYCQVSTNVKWSCTPSFAGVSTCSCPN